MAYYDYRLPPSKPDRAHIVALVVLWAIICGCVISLALLVAAHIGCVQANVDLVGNIYFTECQ